MLFAMHAESCVMVILHIIKSVDTKRLFYGYDATHSSTLPYSLAADDHRFDRRGRAMLLLGRL